jgi:hypothetical protein
VALIDKGVTYEADRYYVEIYAAVVLSVDVVQARLAPQHETLLLHGTGADPCGAPDRPQRQLYDDAAPRIGCAA